MKVAMFSLVAATLAFPALAWQADDPVVQKAIDAVRKIDGKVKIDNDRPGKPVVSVDI